MDSKARFSHKSIMEYFAARTLYEQIKFHHTARNEKAPGEREGPGELI